MVQAVTQGVAVELSGPGEGQPRRRLTLLHRAQSASRHHLSSTKKNIHDIMLGMAIMLAVNSAADKLKLPLLAA